VGILGNDDDVPAEVSCRRTCNLLLFQFWDGMAVVVWIGGDVRLSSKGVETRLGTFAAEVGLRSGEESRVGAWLDGWLRLERWLVRESGR